MAEQNQPALEKFVDLLLDAVCVVDQQGRYVYVSAAFERIFGYAPHDVIGKAMIDLVHPDDRARTLATANDIMAGHPRFNFENRYVCKDGRIVHILWSARWSEETQLRIAVARDVTERKRGEAVQSALHAISEAAHAAGNLEVLLEQVYRIINQLLPARSFYAGIYNEEEDRLQFPCVIDAEPGAFERNRQAVVQLSMETMLQGRPRLCAPQEAMAGWLCVPLIAQRGAIGALMLQQDMPTMAYSAQDMELLQFVSTQVATAIERKQLYDKLQHMAQYDFLTGLPNRELLRDRMDTAMARARRGGSVVSLLYLDLDQFKQVNDRLGHSAGDLLLEEVARRLRYCIREQDTVARIGGDEFVLLLEHIHGPVEAANVALKIANAVSMPLRIEDNTVRIYPSIGIAHYPVDGESLRQLLKHADEAMYAAKRNQPQRLSIDQ
jgi:diguanylate cyclase (GGDEF)-like protein/PAS domain S-box-containing protein